MKNLVLFVLVISTLTSCLKKEISIDKHEAGGVVSNQIELGTDYRYQAYYDFGSDKFVKQNTKTDWDLGFETSPSGSKVILNTSKAMAVTKVLATGFNNVTDTIGASWEYDANSGSLDSTAIGNWIDFGGVYIIDRGFSFDGSHQGYRKLVITSFDNTSFSIHYANLDGSEEQIKTIQKDNEFNFTFLSFQSNDIADIQPKKENWDLVFGQYSHLFSPTFPYLVTGVQSNRNGVEVAKIFDKPFEDITHDDISGYDFSSAINTIGYDWKTFTGSGYVTHFEKNYIVKTTEGFYYKIHFTDFYNQQGDKGTPNFEVREL